MLKGPRLWDLSTRKSPPETRRSNGPPRKLEGSNQRSTIEIPQSRWRVLTSVRDICASGRIA